MEVWCSLVTRTHCDLNIEAEYLLFLSKKSVLMILGPWSIYFTNG